MDRPKSGPETCQCGTEREASIFYITCIFPTLLLWNRFLSLWEKHGMNNAGVLSSLSDSLGIGLHGRTGSEPGKLRSCPGKPHGPWKVGTQHDDRGK